MLTRPSSNSSFGDRGHSNVVSASGDVERAAGLLWVAAALALVAVLWAAGGCVETAECNATVRCPDQQVCYDYECRPICESNSECDGDRQCTPCIAESGSDDQGHCFGREVNACMPQD
jgi:hypothetical protein